MLDVSCHDCSPLGRGRGVGSYGERVLSLVLNVEFMIVIINVIAVMKVIMVAAAIMMFAFVMCCSPATKAPAAKVFDYGHSSASGGGDGGKSGDKQVQFERDESGGKGCFCLYFSVSRCL